MIGAWADAEEPEPDAAERLRILVRECVELEIPRRALLLRLSRLPQQLAQPHHLRLAWAALEPLAVADRARLFRLPGGDLVMIWRGEAEAALQATRNAVLHLFEDAGGRLADPAALLDTLRLPADAEILLAAVDDAVRPPAPASSTAGPPAPPLDPAGLAAVEAALAQVDVASFVRRRPVCENASGAFRLRWESRLLSLAEIASVLVPDRNLRADPWLFRRLTRTLDRRMLALLAAPQELRAARPFGITLNVASILSPGFLRFDATLPGTLRGQIVLGLFPEDMMADPAAFLFARDFARARGYRLLLSGMTADLLDVFPLRRLGLDLLQLRCSPDLLRRNPDLPDAGRTVLSGAHDSEAIAWGRAHGITLFQGHAVVPDMARAGFAA